jgi:DNA-binding transcriptional MerR regulator/mannose-6-phosphate isomerase-like protein (cupin superfamily)
MPREYSIGEAARIIGVSPSTVRLWEDQGLVATRRTSAGHRRFDSAGIQRLHEVRDIREEHRRPLALIREHMAPQSQTPVESTTPGAEEVHLGTRLRAARQSQGLSLRGLAERASVAASHVSAIEHGHARASVATLQKLTNALGITVGSLREAGIPACALVRGGEAGVLDVGIPGVRIEDLAPAAAALEPQLFTVAPGAGSGGSYRHEGEEFLFVLSGVLEVVLDSTERYLVGAGDSLCYASTRGHRWRNVSTEAARLLWVNTPPTF